MLPAISLLAAPTSAIEKISSSPACPRLRFKNADQAANSKPVAAAAGASVTPEPQLWKTRHQMAVRYKGSVRTIDDWCNAGTLPFYKHGGVDVAAAAVSTPFGLGPTVASAPEVLLSVGGGGGGGLPPMNNFGRPNGE
jgi:hypothetical protein